MRQNRGLPVLGKEEMDGIIAQEKKMRASRGAPKIRAAEIQFACVEHMAAGLAAFYEDGLIVLLCPVCKKVKGQIEVADNARVWMEYVN
jgi:hypothetical protein